jgi:ABC-type multidrug transport system ATPase subunit
MSEGIRYAAEFTSHLARVLDAGDATDRVQTVLFRALGGRFTLAPEALEQIVAQAMDPVQRLQVSDGEQRAMIARFGRDAPQQLQQAMGTDSRLTDFAATHGPSESLLLLDAMFHVSSEAGTIEDSRAARIQRAAAQLMVDPRLVSYLFRRHDLRYAKGDFEVRLTSHEAIIGRSADCTLQLPDPQVGLRHTRLRKVGSGWEVEDLKSGRGTLLNGEPVRRSPFVPGDELRIGPYTLSLNADGSRLFAFGAQSFSTLSVRALKRKIGDIVLLDDLSFTVFSGEVIAILGPSGAGKTTLLSAINGTAKADSGEVLRNGRNFHRLLRYDPTQIGTVPQEDVVHAELTVAESLFFAGQLRLPTGTETAAIQSQVNRVLNSLGIEHIRNSRIGSAERRGISGGQRKRVNVGQELLTQSTRIMFLDEPTSGLDPKTGHDIVGLARQLADEGRTIFIVTHDVGEDLMAMVDHLLVMAPGGRLAWFGPPAEACTYFDVPTVAGIFSVIGDKTPEAWRTAYKASSAWKTWVGMRESLLGMVSTESSKTVNAPRNGPREWLGQYLTLVRRYARVKWRDTVGTAVLMGQAPILAVAMIIAFPEPDASAMFMMALSSLWFGASDAVRELIAERTIWRRESRNGLSLAPYLASKLTILGCIVTVQCGILVSLNYLALDLASFGFSLAGLMGACTLIGMVGVCLGLWMSAMFPTSEAAIGSLPVLLIPQITFGGLLVTVKNMGVAGKAMSTVMITRYGFELIIKTGDALAVPGRRGTGGRTEQVMATLWDLGFRSAEADDLGLTTMLLSTILFCFCGVFLSLASFFTLRTTKGS